MDNYLSAIKFRQTRFFLRKYALRVLRLLRLQSSGQQFGDHLSVSIGGEGRNARKTQVLAGLGLGCPVLSW
jgi:hypothetical protein